MKTKGNVVVIMKINGHEFEFGIKKLHSMWQIKSLCNMMTRIFKKALNREAVKGAEDILKKGG